jgi:hypothetical protein
MALDCLAGCSYRLSGGRRVSQQTSSILDSAIVLQFSLNLWKLPKSDDEPEFRARLGVVANLSICFGRRRENVACQVTIPPFVQHVSKSKDLPKFRAFLHVKIRGFGVVDSYDFKTKAFWKLFNTTSSSSGPKRPRSQQPRSMDLQPAKKSFTV